MREVEQRLQQPESQIQRGSHEPVVIYDAKQGAQEKELFSIEDIARARGEENIEKVGIQIYKEMRKDPAIEAEYHFTVGKSGKRRHLKYFRREAFEKLTRRSILPDGKTISVPKEDPTQKNIIAILTDSKKRNRTVTEEELLSDIPEFRKLPYEKATGRLSRKVRLVNKKVNPQGWKITMDTDLENPTRKLFSLMHFYTTRDVQLATGIESERTVRRYIQKLIEREGRRIELNEEQFRIVIDYALSKMGSSLTKEPLTFPDAQPTPNFKEVDQKQLLMRLIDARNEERPFYIQESLDPVDSSPIARQFAEWNFRKRINRLGKNKDMKRKGWGIDSLTQDAYFLRQEKESPQELRDLLETKRQIHINSTVIVLEHLTEERPADNLNLRNIHILLANALQRSSPESTLPSVFKDTTSEHLEKFFIYGFAHTLERLWERKETKSLSEEEKEIMASCNRLKQIGWDTQKIINFAKTHFSVPNRGDEKLSA